jgi:hypothetical protein
MIITVLICLHSYGMNPRVQFVMIFYSSSYCPRITPVGSFEILRFYNWKLNLVVKMSVSVLMGLLQRHERTVDPLRISELSYQMLDSLLHTQRITETKQWWWLIQVQPLNSRTSMSFVKRRAVHWQVL